MKRSLRGSLRARLLAGTVLWIVLAIAFAGWALSGLFRQHISSQLANEFNVHLNQLVAALSIDTQGRPTLAFEPTDPRLQLPYSGLYWQIDQLNLDGSSQAAVLQSRSLWDQTLRTPNNTSNPKAPASQRSALPAELSALSAADGTPLVALMRTVTPPEGESRYRLIFAGDARLLNEPLQRFQLMLFIALGLLALGLAAAAMLQVLIGLKPLVKLRRELAAVREGTTNRIESSYPSEIQPLVDDFNQVLQNNNEIVQRARTQAGNLAHALKTPLSVLANGAREENTAFGRMVAEQTSLAQRHVNHHLARARAAAAVRTPGLRTVVKPVIATLARVMQQLYIDKGIQIHTDQITDTLVFKGEQHDLQELLGNLMDNACKWSRTNVWIRASLADNTLVLHVEDDGPGLAEGNMEKAFERGTRLDEQTPGSGLGLAIVRDLAQAYGGSVRAHASDKGGLGVELRLPG